MPLEVHEYEHWWIGLYQFFLYANAQLMVLSIDWISLANLLIKSEFLRYHGFYLQRVSSRLSLVWRLLKCFVDICVYKFEIGARSKFINSYEFVSDNAVLKNVYIKAFCIPIWYELFS